jgi:hypothetical protein
MVDFPALGRNDLVGQLADPRICQPALSLVSMAIE